MSKDKPTDPVVEELHLTKSGLEITLSDPAIKTIAAHMAHIFVQTFARNYIEQHLEFDPNASVKIEMFGESKEKDPNFPGEFERVPLLFTMQHRWGKTPHALRKEAVEALEGLMRFVRDEDMVMKESQEALRVIKEFREKKEEKKNG